MKFNSSATSIVRQLVSHGYEAYIVGGAVRDMLLERTPKDYDITTSATPEQVRSVFGRRKCRIIGRRFRLALVFSGGETYEVSTFRREPSSDERCGRVHDDGIMIWNDNQYGTFEDDVMRRDFTVNALYYDVFEDEIVDMVGGTDDIRSRTVRCIGNPDTRFQEDPVRMLRALKLVGQYGFTPCDNVRNAIQKRGCLIQEASSARLFEELMKIMASEHALGIFSACSKYGLLKHFCPMLGQLWNTEGGNIIKEMLRLYCRSLVEEDDYFHEKSFALSVLCLPYLLIVMGADGEGARISKIEAGSCCLPAIHEFFSTFAVPKEVEFDIRDLAVMVAMLAEGRSSARLESSLLYPRAYELFRLLTMASGFMVEIFSRLQPPLEESAKVLCGPAMQPVEEAAADGQATEEAAEELEAQQRPKRRRRRRSRVNAVAENAEADADAGSAEAASDEQEAPGPQQKAPRRRRSKKAAAEAALETAEVQDAGDDAIAEKTKKIRRRRRSSNARHKADDGHEGAYGESNAAYENE